MKEECYISTWHDELKKRREESEISQGALAAAVGISREYLNKIENGKRIASEALQRRLEKMLALKDINSCMRIMFDYLKVRFRTQKIESVVENVLKIPFDRFYQDGYGFNGYNRLYRCFDIAVMVSDDPMKGTIIEMKGKGCRQFEGILIAQGRSWYDFLGDCLAYCEDVAFKRLDIAIDDTIGFLNVRELIDKCERRECVSRFDRFETRLSGQGLRQERDDGIIMGDTLYLGSKNSELRFCIYQKDIEQYLKKRTPIEEANVQNRFEIRLKNDRAMNAVKDLLGGYDVEDTAFCIINRYVSFLDAKEGQDPAEWKPSPQWLWFIGEGRGTLRLTTRPEAYTWEKSMRWLRNQCSHVIATALEIDDRQGTSLMADMIQDAKLTQKEKYKKIIKQVTTSTDDLLLSNH